MSRQVCEGCGRPEKVCLCSHLIHYRLPFELIIWQDPDEAKHPLSTAPLLHRSIDGCRLLVGDDFGYPDVFSDAEASRVALLYPDNEAAVQAPSHRPAGIDKVLVLDGTWRKVRRLILRNPWLLELPRVSLKPDSESRYLRCSTVDGGVSTLEAVLLLADQWNPEEGYREGIRVLNRMAELQERMRRQ